MKKNTMLAVSCVLGLMAAEVGSQPAPQDIRGVWQVTEVTITGPNARVISGRDGLLILAGGHYSFTRVTTPSHHVRLKNLAQIQTRHLILNSLAFHRRDRPFRLFHDYDYPSAVVPFVELRQSAGHECGRGAGYAGQLISTSTSDESPTSISTLSSTWSGTGTV